METSEREDVEASYLLGFLDDHEELDGGILSGYDDLDYPGIYKNNKSSFANWAETNDVRNNLKPTLELENQKRVSLQFTAPITSLCRKERSLNSSPKKRLPCTIGCKSLDDLELMSRQRSLWSQFALTFAESIPKDVSKQESLANVNLQEEEEKPLEKKSKSWCPSKRKTAFLLRPVCPQTEKGKICVTGLNNSCTTDTMQSILSTKSINLAQANFISFDCKDAQKNKDVSLVRGKFSSSMNLPTYIKTSVQLGNFPGDAKNEFPRRENIDRRNAVPFVEFEPDFLYDSDDTDDSDKVSDLLEDDLEKGSATIAAFLVTFIAVWFFGTMVGVFFVTMSVSGDYQGRLITHELCKSFPEWSFLNGSGVSWCDPKIFNYHFQLSVQCPCFSSDHNPSLNSSLGVHYTLPPFKLRE